MQTNNNLRQFNDIAQRVKYRKASKSNQEQGEMRDALSTLKQYIQQSRADLRLKPGKQSTLNEETKNHNIAVKNQLTTLYQNNTETLKQTIKKGIELVDPDSENAKSIQFRTNCTKLNSFIKNTNENLSEKKIEVFKKIRQRMEENKRIINSFKTLMTNESDNLDLDFQKTDRLAKKLMQAVELRMKENEKFEEIIERADPQKFNINHEGKALSKQYELITTKTENKKGALSSDDMNTIFDSYSRNLFTSTTDHKYDNIAFATKYSLKGSETGAAEYLEEIINTRIKNPNTPLFLNMEEEINNSEMENAYKGSGNLFVNKQSKLKLLGALYDAKEEMGDISNQADKATANQVFNEALDVIRELESKAFYRGKEESRARTEKLIEYAAEAYGQLTKKGGEINNSLLLKIKDEITNTKTQITDIEQAGRELMGKYVNLTKEYRNAENQQTAAIDGKESTYLKIPILRKQLQDNWNEGHTTEKGFLEELINWKKDVLNRLNPLNNTYLINNESLDIYKDAGRITKDAISLLTNLGGGNQQADKVEEATEEMRKYRKQFAENLKAAKLKDTTETENYENTINTTLTQETKKGGIYGTVSPELIPDLVP